MFIQSSPLILLKKRWKIILFSGLVLAVFSGFISLLFPLEYRADAQVLIISKSRYGVDPYTVAKSAERIGENLVQVVKTNDFYNKVLNQSEYNLDKSGFENISEVKKRKKWQKQVKASVVYGTSVLDIMAYNSNREQAKNYDNATANVLVSQGWQYVGGDVTIKVVNDAVSGKWPVRPNLAINTFLGFIVGALFSFLLVLKK